MGRAKRPARFFSKEELEVIRHAIERAEAGTSGEIRVHIDARCPGDPVVAAREWFEKLGMAATRQRNGILLYLAVADHKFALYGDEGIHGALPEGTWERLRDEMLAEFRLDRFAEGVSHAVKELGAALQHQFPHLPDDTDELSDEVSVSDD
jgi:uncharacterized membrane protein